MMAMDDCAKGYTMPRVSEFFGIVIWMYYRDHQPPHFHAKYGNDEALILIGSGEVYEGKVSRRALRLVQEWEELHRAELERNWELAREQLPLNEITPLS
jgi:hypothetical protein